MPEHQHHVEAGFDLGPYVFRRVRCFAGEPGECETATIAVKRPDIPHETIPIALCIKRDSGQWEGLMLPFARTEADDIERQGIKVVELRTEGDVQILDRYIVPFCLPLGTMIEREMKENDRGS